jgi:hypothetical protein
VETTGVAVVDCVVSSLWLLLLSFPEPLCVVVCGGGVVVEDVEEELVDDVTGGVEEADEVDSADGVV